MKLKDFDAVNQLRRDRYTLLCKIDKLDTIRVLIDSEFQTLELSEALKTAVMEILKAELAVVERKLAELGVEI